MMVVVRKLWRGKYSLPQAFWIFYVGLSSLSIVVAMPILAISMNVSDRLYSFAYEAIAIIRIILLIWTSVGVWRSARSYVASPVRISQIWGYVARVTVVYWAGRVVWNNVAPFIHQLSN